MAEGARPDGLGLRRRCRYRRHGYARVPDRLPGREDPMTAQVIAGPPHDCATDGHMVALRLTWDVENVLVTPFCEVCRLIMLPSAVMCGAEADWLMRQVDNARFAREAPPEAYETTLR
jgi:hypothetical protein